ncbi:MAG: VWA domain-containing protein [Capsulimonadaceae bacterium]
MQSPIAFDRPLALLLAPVLLWLFWVVARKSYAGLHPQTSLLALGARVIAVLALVLAIAGMHMVKRTDKLATLFLIDVSKSIRPDQRAAGLDYVRKALASKPHDDAAGIIVFGRDAYLEEPPSTTLTDLNDLEPAVAGDATDLQDALRLAAQTFPADSGRKIVLVTDGNENIGDAAAEIDSLRQQGVRVDVAPSDLSVGPDGQALPEALIDGMTMPTNVRKSAPFTLRIVTESTVPQPATLTITRDGKQIVTQTVQMRSGKTAFQFQEKVTTPGFHRYDAQIDPQSDQIPDNNHAYGYVNVQARPRVLYVCDPDEPSTDFQQAMAAQDIDVDVVDPSGVPSSISGLETYDEVVLSDVDADEIGAPAMAGIEESVRDFGLGLGMIGGPQSYAAGGYTGTPVEDALPVTMEVKDRKRIPPAAVAMVIEDLEEPTSVNWSIEAAKAAVDLLEPQDTVGVLDCNGVWRIPLQKVIDRAAIKSQMDQLYGMNDPPTYTPYLQQATDALLATDAPIKHVIFFGDGDAVMEASQDIAVIQELHKKGVTISTIASGADADGIKFLSAIATLGGGRSYVAERATDLPGLLMKDQQTATRQYVIEKPFLARPTGYDDVTAGIDWTSEPALEGYNVATAKPGATVGLTALDHNDPVYAHWRYGLGRTFAFTSDDRAHWASAWLPWDGYERFWAQAVRWSLKSNDGGNFHAMVDNQDGKGHLVVDAFSDQSGFINGAHLSARVVAPDQTVKTVDLTQTEPGRYESTFDTDQTGSYMVNVRQTPSSPSPGQGEGRGEVSGNQTVGLVVPYSPEYRTITPNLALLTRLSEGTGGTFQADPTRIFRDAASWMVANVDIAPTLLALAALLFLFDIAARRLGLRWEKVAATVTEGVEATSTKLDDLRKARAAARSPLLQPAPQMSRLLERKTAARAGMKDDDAESAAGRLLNRRVSARPGMDDPFPRVASLQTPPPPRPPGDPAEGAYTNRLLDAKRRAKERDL